MKSILRLDKVVFDKIEFNRLGFKNDTELKLEIQTNIGERKDKAAYKVTVHSRVNSNLFSFITE